MKSYSVRCIIEWPDGSRPSGQPLDHKYLYEERITIWQAKSLDEAIEKAESEVKQYCSKNGFRFIELSQGYFMFTAIEADGIEAYSLLRESDLEPSDYLDAFFDTGAERESKI